jgi:DHA1 family bicyclomycin/chloramphenicol resistance-like MFS transporter
VPTLVMALATDTGSVQLTISLFVLGLAASQLLLGPLSDRFGRRPVVLAGLALAFLSSIAAAAAADIATLVLARLLQALGASTGMVIGRAIIRDLFDRDRAAAMIGLVATAMVVAPMVAPLIGGLLDTAFGWQAIFIFLALANGAVLLWALAALAETRPSPVAGSARPRLATHARDLAASRLFLGYVICGAFGSGPFFAFIGGGPHVIVTIMERTSAEYGLWFAATSVGYMGGNFTASRLSMRYGVDPLICWGLVVILAGSMFGVGWVVLQPTGGPATVFLPLLVTGFGNGLILPNALAGAVSVRPEAAGTASGICGFAQLGLGAATAQFVGHIIAGATTALPMMLLMLAFGIAGLIAFAALIRRAPNG